MSDDRDFVSAAAGLGEIEQLDVPAMELLFRLECSGEDFYNALAERVGNEEAAQLLRRNGREETKHGERVTQAIAILQGAAG